MPITVRDLEQWAYRMPLPDFRAAATMCSILNLFSAPNYISAIQGRLTGILGSVTHQVSRVRNGLKNAYVGVGNETTSIIVMEGVSIRAQFDAFFRSAGSRPNPEDYVINFVQGSEVDVWEEWRNTNFPPSRNVILAGHSMGAAMCNALALRLCRTNSADSVKVFTFGCPKVFTRHGARVYRGFPITCWRIQLVDDLITNWPIDDGAIVVGSPTLRAAIPLDIWRQWTYVGTGITLLQAPPLFTPFDAPQFDGNLPAAGDVLHLALANAAIQQTHQLNTYRSVMSTILARYEEWEAERARLRALGEAGQIPAPVPRQGPGNIPPGIVRIVPGQEPRPPEFNVRPPSSEDTPVPLPSIAGGDGIGGTAFLEPVPMERYLVAVRKINKGQYVLFWMGRVVAAETNRSSARAVAKRLNNSLRHLAILESVEATSMVQSWSDWLSIANAFIPPVAVN